jgi:hypothetical protein
VLSRFRLAKFNMQLHVAHFIRRLDVALRGHHGAVLNRPRRGAAGLLVAPVRKAFAVEQHSRVAGRRGLRAERAGRDDGRLRTRRVVDMPFAVRLHRRVVKARDAVNDDFGDLRFRLGLRQGHVRGHGHEGENKDSSFHFI